VSIVFKYRYPSRLSKISQRRVHEKDMPKATKQTIPQKCSVEYRVCVGGDVGSGN
jgi:hypothetical protein